MSGLSRTPGKRVRANNPPRVRIPLSPPYPKNPKIVSQINDLSFYGFSLKPHAFSTYGIGHLKVKWT